MRTVVLAYNEVGYRCLKTLLRAGVEICAVFSHEDDPRESCWFGSVAELAREHRLELHTPASINAPEWVERIAAVKPELILSFYYRELVCSEILSIPRVGAFNMHGSLLPNYRGRSPVNWALLRGETQTGVTLHEMIKQPDAGDIVGSRAVEIQPTDDALSLSIKISEAAAGLLEELLPALRSGDLERRPQDLAMGSYFGGRRPEDGRIDWRAPASEIHDLVRAVTRPWPGAFTEFNGRKLYVWESEVDPRPPGGTPGTVESDEPLTVACGCGRLVFRRWQFEGEKDRNFNQNRRLDDPDRGSLLGPP